MKFFTSVIAKTRCSSRHTMSSCIGLVIVLAVLGYSEIAEVQVRPSLAASLPPNGSQTAQENRPISIGGPNGNARSLAAGAELPFRDFDDHVPGGAPADLIAEVQDVLEGRLISIWPSAGSERVPVFWVRVDSGAELVVINAMLQDAPVRREEFDMSPIMFYRLTRLMAYYDAIPSVPAFTSVVARDNSDIFHWLSGTEENKAVLEELCCDPEFVFDGDKWTTTYNAFRRDGSVFRWRIIGRYNPQTNVVRILRLDVTPVKPPGTFGWPY